MAYPWAATGPGTLGAYFGMTGIDGTHELVCKADCPDSHQKLTNFHYVPFQNIPFK